MKRMMVNTGRSYDILVGRGLEEMLGSVAAMGLRAAVVTDDHVDALYGEAVMDLLARLGYMPCKFVFPAGESSKTLDTAGQVYGFLAEHQITRSDVIVALGGGVVGDLAGFVAATWLRGVRFIQIPTTLLAMVDSSVGGKTAVDIVQGKNLVGAFWQPSLVVCALELLESLPPEQMAEGTAEIIKYGAIFDEPLFEQLRAGDLQNRIEEIVWRCIDLKRQVVERDERDVGERQLLNFGHTLAHAIEKESSFTVSHGQAVAIGMVEITRSCERRGITPQGTAERLAACCARYGLPATTEYPLDALSVHCAGDKKRAGDLLTLITLEQMGKAVLTPVKANDLLLFLKGDANV